MEKYFSNGDITRSNKPRKKDAYNSKRYQGGSSDDEMEQQDSDDDFDRDGDPLSLQELDGWMNQVNQKNELQDDELEESIQDQARVEEGEDTYSTPVNDSKRSKQ